MPRSAKGRTVPTRYPSRVILDLHPDDHRALHDAGLRDRVPMSDRLRALISLWRASGPLAAAVSEHAQQTPPATSSPRAGGPDSPPRAVKRLTLDLTEDDHHALLGARYADRVTMSARLRALISLWRQDSELAAAVSDRAHQNLLNDRPAVYLDLDSPPVPPGNRQQDPPDRQSIDLDRRPQHTPPDC